MCTVLSMQSICNKVQRRGDAPFVWMFNEIKHQTYYSFRSQLLMFVYVFPCSYCQNNYSLSKTNKASEPLKVTETFSRSSTFNEMRLSLFLELNLVIRRLQM